MRRRLPPSFWSAALAAACAAGGCGGTSSYELHWTVSCTSASGKSQAKGCPLRSARDCSAAGLGAIEVTATNAGGNAGPRITFPCFSSPDGPMGLGPDMGSGRYKLLVMPLTLAGHPVGTGKIVTVDVPSQGYVSASVVLPRPTQCSDGVDNDHDGLVDLFDPGCTNVDDPLEQ